jgi:hypothetical protein
MRGDVQQELATMSCVHQLGFGWSPERESAKDEGPGVEGQRLSTIFSLFANKLNGIELFEFTLRDGKNGCGPLETISDRQKTVGRRFRWLDVGCIMGWILVP